ncbi:MAG: hypothetical protein CVV41_08675 [Candidatus Riflebacteria bacterium HGW-Riflebacteria-1]|jgi:tetratricopeptide (TPR) repeat protein|nr:MAG: hypothetical protein CVV41_08675 [Candidatus Riflebacteria bacterium HGW-Riflebacteria-1]
MNSEKYREIQAHVNDGDARRNVGEWGEAKISYLKAIEEFNAICEIDPHAPMTAEQVDLQKTINGRIEDVNSHLASVHLDKGRAALDNKAWQIAIDELEEATRLAKDDSIAFLEEVKVLLDKSRNGHRDAMIRSELTPFVDRGDDFKRSGNFGEAILEFQEAAKKAAGLPEHHKYVVYIKNSLTECRRSIIRPYLAKINKACHAGKFAMASGFLKRAQLLLDSTDNVYHAFLEQLKEKIQLNLKEDEFVETEEFEAPEVWEKAVKDYEEALDLYSSFTVTDPFAPAYTGVNVFEDKFIDSRRKLGKLYKTRADRLRDQAKIEKAIRNYKEAIRLLPRSDKLFHEAFKEMKKLRAQIAVP